MKKLLVILLLFGMIGCTHKINSTNPAVINVVTLLDAENTCNTISHGLQEANATLTSLGEKEYYTSVHPKLVQIAQLNEKANQAILAFKAGNTTIDWKSALIAVSASVGDPNTLTTFGFKNPKSQQIAQLGFATLTTALSLAAAYGGK